MAAGSLDLHKITSELVNAAVALREYQSSKRVNHAEYATLLATLHRKLFIAAAQYRLDDAVSRHYWRCDTCGTIVDVDTPYCRCQDPAVPFWRLVYVPPDEKHPA